MTKRYSGTPGRLRALPTAPAGAWSAFVPLHTAPRAAAERGRKGAVVGTCQVGRLALGRDVRAGWHGEGLQESDTLLLSLFLQRDICRGLG